MKITTEKLKCDECGVEKSRTIAPAQYGGCNPFADWIVNVNNHLDFCSAKCAAKHFRLWNKVDK